MERGTHTHTHTTETRKWTKGHGQGRKKILQASEVSVGQSTKNIVTVPGKWTVDNWLGSRVHQGDSTF